MQRFFTTRRSRSHQLLRGTAVAALAFGLIASPGLLDGDGGLPFGDGAAMAAPGGNGNGNGNAGAGNRGGGPDGAGANAGNQGNGRSTAPGLQKNGSSSGVAANSESDGAVGDDEDESTIRDSIKALADELGGRLNALNSAINGNTENAAPHSAAGLAHSATQAMQEGDSEQLGEDLGNLSNAKEAPEESAEDEDDSLAHAIDNLADDFNSLFGGGDDSAINGDEAAAKTRETITAKDGDVGLGSLKEDTEGDSEEQSTASNEEDDDEDDEQL